MAQTQSELKPDGPSTGPALRGYLIYQGMVIVAIIEADCVECAWKIRDAQYPGCLVSVPLNEKWQFGMCIHTARKLQRQHKDMEP